MALDGIPSSVKESKGPSSGMHVEFPTKEHYTLDEVLEMVQRIHNSWADRYLGAMLQLFRPGLIYGKEKADSAKRMMQEGKFIQEVMQRAEAEVANATGLSHSDRMKALGLRLIKMGEDVSAGKNPLPKSGRPKTDNTKKYGSGVP